MSGLRFKIAGLEREIVTLQGMSKAFLDTNTSWVLDQYISQVRSIQSAPLQTTHKLRLCCLRTRESSEYEGTGRKAVVAVRAEITGVWEVMKIDRKSVESIGKASTKIELYASDCSDRLAMWRLELGAYDSPGCYVHAQVLGDKPQQPFPKSVPVPRLPSLFLTPMGAVEFALGELFQDTWARVTAQGSGHATTWRGIQTSRWKGLMDWYASVVAQSDSSPWIALKMAKPDGSIAVG